MSASVLRTPTGGIVYDDFSDFKPEEALFTREYWTRRGEVGSVAGGRGQVLFVPVGDRRWVLRHYRRGGWIARWVADSYLWLGREATRSFREWRLLATLHAEGFPVPVPVAARYVRSGLVYRADLITWEIPEAQTLADSIAGAQLPLDRWRRIGQLIARLHARGVHHVDLNAHNLLLEADGTVHVIDFDRARIRGQGRWQRSVLARLKRSLEKVKGQRRDARFGATEWQALLAGYNSRGQGTGDRGQ